MDAVEIEWIDNYNATVRSKLSPLMKELFPQSLDYLYHETKPIELTKFRQNEYSINGVLENHELVVHLINLKNFNFRCSQEIKDV